MGVCQMQLTPTSNVNVPSVRFCCTHNFFLTAESQACIHSSISHKYTYTLITPTLSFKHNIQNTMLNNSKREREREPLY